MIVQLCNAPLWSVSRSTIECSEGFNRPILEYIRPNERPRRIDCEENAERMRPTPLHESPDLAGWMGGWMEVKVNGWMKSMGEWVGGWIDGWVDGWVDGWMMGGSVGEWVGGWTDGWID